MRDPIESLRVDSLRHLPQQPFTAPVQAINLVGGSVRLQIGGSSAWQWFRCVENAGLSHVSVGQIAVCTVFDGEPVVVGFLPVGGNLRKTPTHDHSTDAEGGEIIRPGGVWLMGQVVLDLDFTGTDYDTKAECQELGLRFSDSDTPFPDQFRYSVSGTWSHSAGNGWLPALPSDTEGPAILIPLDRGANWELEVGITFSPSNVAHEMAITFGYATNSNHFGALAFIADNSAVASQLIAYLLTNDGDDTHTTQYTGNALVDTGDRTYRFRCQNACVSIWDDEDDAWNHYTGHQSAGIAYTAAHAFIQFYKYTGATFATTYIRSLKLTYLL